MPYSDVITESMLCRQCGNAIEEGRFQHRPPTEAKYCLKCRTERRRQANLKYIWRLRTQIRQMILTCRQKAPNTFSQWKRIV